MNNAGHHHHNNDDDDDDDNNSEMQMQRSQTRSYRIRKFLFSCFNVRVLAAKMIYYPLNYEPFIPSPRSRPLFSFHLAIGLLWSVPSFCVKLGGIPIDPIPTIPPIISGSANALAYIFLTCAQSTRMCIQLVFCFVRWQRVFMTALCANSFWVKR